MSESPVLSLILLLRAVGEGSRHGNWRKGEVVFVIVFRGWYSKVMGFENLRTEPGTEGVTETIWICEQDVSEWNCECLTCIHMYLGYLGKGWCDKDSWWSQSSILMSLCNVYKQLCVIINMHLPEYLKLSHVWMRWCICVCECVCLGNGMVYMCDLRMCLWHTQIFGQFWGDQMHRRKKPKDRTGCLIDLFYLLSSFCICPMEWSSVALYKFWKLCCCPPFSAHGCGAAMKTAG